MRNNTCQKFTLFLFLFIYLILQAATGTMNGIIDTVAAVHPLKPLLDLIKTNGKLILVGAQSLEKPLEVPAIPHCWVVAIACTANGWHQPLTIGSHFFNG
jgi:D-arabinose 1-dehydrogenase-like Zn-dependent alcohol dehydrogenase